MKLSRTEVCNLLNIDEKELKKNFSKLKIKSQKKRNPESWGTLLKLAKVYIPNEEKL